MVPFKRCQIVMFAFVGQLEEGGGIILMGDIRYVHLYADKGKEITAKSIWIITIIGTRFDVELTECIM